MAIDPQRKKRAGLLSTPPGYEGVGINPAGGGMPARRQTRMTATPAQPTAPATPAQPTMATAPAQPAPAFDPQDESVSGRLTSLLDQDNAYMRQAATTGKQAANRRGLLNSTMGVSAVESSRIAAALPIASQEAGQVHETNLQGRDIESRERMQGREFEHETGLQGRQFEHETGMQGRDIESRERMQGRDISAQRDLLERELGSREKMQQAEIAAEKERLGEQLSQQERLALQDLRAAEERLGMELESRERIAGQDTASRERMAALDAETRERIAGLDREAQERIANLDVATRERAAASQLAASFEESYATIVANIMANPDIPAAERQRMLDHAARTRDSNLALVEQMYNVELDWTGGGSPTPRPGAQPGGPGRPRSGLMSEQRSRELFPPREGVAR